MKIIVLVIMLVLIGYIFWQRWLLKQQSYDLANLEKACAGYNSQIQNMAIQHQSTFNALQAQKLMLELVGSDLNKVIKGDYSVEPPSDKRVKEIKHNIKRLTGRDL
ncbi:hypothetical protein EFT49_11070 [Leuconostoc falkenbergense]|uniref:hypothetical protein n=1 Tax=Leuconostoc falkenbergense TaxID=2766470 RepID=UPI0021AA2172|nr:hypothetical protein [Leuconostoc falkenbergense]MCT4420700.1 hypothetical protein [Leuconostoc falkenbergense]